MLTACEDPTNDLYLSVASVWEIQIKSQLKKLALDLPLEELIRQQQAANDFLILPIELSHVLALNGLPPHHKDPFDRLLIAQAQVEDAALVSNDSVFQHYQVTLCW